MGKQHLLSLKFLGGGRSWGKRRKQLFHCSTVAKSPLLRAKRRDRRDREQGWSQVLGTPSSGSSNQRCEAGEESAGSHPRRLCERGVFPICLNPTLQGAHRNAGRLPSRFAPFANQTSQPSSWHRRGGLLGACAFVRSHVDLQKPPARLVQGPRAHSQGEASAFRLPAAVRGPLPLPVPFPQEQQILGARTDRHFQARLWVVQGRARWHGWESKQTKKRDKMHTF